MIKVILSNGFFYKGEILGEDIDFLMILDINNKEVRINKKNIVVVENHG